MPSRRQEERDMATSPSPLRIPISNVLLGNDYTGKLYVGSQRNEVNLLLDTGSSTLAIDHKSYDPRHDPHAKVTTLVQEVAYGDGSNWIGSVVQTDMTVSASGHVVDLPGVAGAVGDHGALPRRVPDGDRTQRRLVQREPEAGHRRRGGGDRSAPADAPEPRTHQRDRRQRHQRPRSRAGAVRCGPRQAVTGAGEADPLTAGLDIEREAGRVAHIDVHAARHRRRHQAGCHPGELLADGCGG